MKKLFKNSQRYKLIYILLGTAISYFSTVGYSTLAVEKKRARSLEMDLKEKILRQLEIMRRDIRLEKAAIEAKEAEEARSVKRIVNIMNRYKKTWLSSSQKKELARLILSESRKYQYDPLLIVAMIMTESSFNNQACSWKGARGLMQIIPTTGEEVAKKIGLEWQGIESLHDPYFNIKSGLYYLATQQERFGDLNISLTAYNYGPTAVRRMITAGRRIPKRYATKVMREYKKLKEETVEIL